MQLITVINMVELAVVQKESFLFPILMILRLYLRAIQDMLPQK